MYEAALQLIATSLVSFGADDSQTTMDDAITTSTPCGLPRPSLRIEIADPNALLPEADARWLLDSATRVVQAIPASGGLIGGQLGALSLVGRSLADEVLSGEVRVLIVNDSEMSAAHFEYCEIEGTTDVLTFDLSEVESFEDEMTEVDPNEAGVKERVPQTTGRLALVPLLPTLDVDILVCADEAARQAGLHGHSVAQELLLYILHGTLHCLGHDDHDETAHAAMHAAEDRVLAASGIGPTFAPGLRSDAQSAMGGRS